MTMNKALQNLMEKEMTRKEFLAACGLGIASLLGFGSLIRMLNGKDQATGGAGLTNGYGVHRYGR
ncbi:MAG TPA: hypothetical protein VLF62_01125 [Candidatus Saccharimonadales bacterium]|nr:hypothetical protein [Candidatus Saccharimonadales bacterium]